MAAALQIQPHTHEPRQQTMHKSRGLNFHFPARQHGICMNNGARRVVVAVVIISNRRWMLMLS